MKTKRPTALDYWPDSHLSESHSDSESDEAENAFVQKWLVPPRNEAEPNRTIYSRPPSYERLDFDGEGIHDRASPISDSEELEEGELREDPQLRTYRSIVEENTPPDHYETDLKVLALKEEFLRLLNSIISPSMLSKKMIETMRLQYEGIDRSNPTYGTVRTFSWIVPLRNFVHISSKCARIVNRWNNNGLIQKLDHTR